MSYSHFAPAEAKFGQSESETIKKYFGAYRFLYNGEIALLKQKTSEELKEIYQLPSSVSEIYLHISDIAKETDFMKESEGYDVGILDSFCRSIAMVIKNDIKDAGFEMENLKFMKKKEVQTIAVETRYPGKNCFVAMFSEPIRDELLKHNDLFQTYSLTVDFKNCVAKTEYRQLA